MGSLGTFLQVVGPRLEALGPLEVPSPILGQSLYMPKLQSLFVLGNFPGIRAAR